MDALGLIGADDHIRECGTILKNEDGIVLSGFRLFVADSCYSTV
jgi:hypothetical protein